jgi:hypothetical protein
MVATLADYGLFFPCQLQSLEDFGHQTRLCCNKSGRYEKRMLLVKLDLLGLGLEFI